MRTHVADHETLARIAFTLEVMAGISKLEWDSEAGEYTTDSVKAMVDSMVDSGSYGIRIPKGSAVACTKLGANAGIAVPTPGIVGRAAIDPYVGIPTFWFIEVNGTVDAGGSFHVTGVNGDGRFRRDGSNGDVWILAPVLYEVFDATQADYVTHFISKTKLSGMTAQPGAYLPDGSLRPFMVYAKYPMVNNGGTPASISGLKPWNRNVSHNSLITQCKTATTGYAGKSYADDWYVKTMFLMKYATKHSQSVFAGCTSYDRQYSVTVAESNVTRVIVSKANAANLLVGSACMLGTHTGNNDRNTASNYDVFDGLKIVKIEDYDSGNSAVYFDAPAAFTTAVGYFLSSSPWHTGACDAVEGDGSPTNPLSGAEPFVLQGIELGHGLYEILGDVILYSDGTNGEEICLNPDSRNEATSVTANYTHTGKYLPTGETAGWKYPLYPDRADGLFFGTETGASQTTGMCDGSYTVAQATAGSYEWLGLGVLGNGGIAGLWCVSGNFGLGISYWHLGSRLSGLGRKRGVNSV